MRKPYDLAPLGDLACFESAARNLSFKQAAQELNVTPAAVSHRIKALESELGQGLFTRQYRGVELTEAGALLFVALQRGFETISDAVVRIRARQDRAGVSLAATTAMSALWLTPRLAAFWKAHPGVAISQIIQDDGTGHGVDLSIHYGDPAREADETRVLFHDRILALGSPEFAAAQGIRDVQDLARAPLIHTQSGTNPYTEWPDWFAAMGIEAPQGPGFYLNSYLISLNAAEDHIGAVLGWEGLLGGSLTSGRLVQLVPDAMASPSPFYLRIHNRASANARLFADWLAAPEA
ncbi:LysR family transcriptional regulator [Salipiger aestuarii]|uniref:DNA-binding transcriptional LysR family regulator n=1 Tax=Salipiger aestuarii TaxID=568098 RepID=A0A327Y701_9RHOB|nr:LysR substrate-binding domain-containing protein [Salipiger aestuarii]KAA8608197.1 LysR family transcriptional regulator [Salipiger aestuarii]KAA8611464.1 LysR family transcriptional regulator [Salipiger aestuarii]KAB2541013.1 LysR family transcriptional regulator [Salipiger aestuarii]RAK15525.1 DNA-binding transcriptional LysR family regulator [Salipiger aestuarii]